jgi:lipid II:glycine glycyltransferase (peptidoglycan interpeptide bridge formation enzyme)
MKTEILPSGFDIGRYEKLANHPLQSWYWGEARKAMGIEVVRLADFKDNLIDKVYQMTLHPIPKTGYRIGYLPRSLFPSTSLLDFLSVYGKKNKIIFFKIEPDEETGGQKFAETKTVICRSPHPLFPEWTMTLDLGKSEKELLDGMKPKTRYNIRLAEKKGVTVKEMSDNNGFEVFIKLYFETCSRQKYFGHNYRYHKIIWDNLKNHLSHILIAFYNKTPLAAYELFHFNNKFYYPYGGTSLNHRNLMASNLLMWEAIKLGKKLGAKQFDMWGSLSPGYSFKHPWSGFTRFKEGYGAKFTQMVGSYDLIINPLFYRFYNLAEKARKFYLGLKRGSL